MAKQLSTAEDNSSRNKFYEFIVPFFKTPEGTLILVIFLISIALSIVTDSFLTSYNVLNLLRQSTVLGLIAIASLIVIISGGIDVSVGAIAGLTAMNLAIFLGVFSYPVFLSIILAILIGTGAGLFNGIIIYETSMPSFIATLGTMTIMQGAIKLLSGGRTVSGLPVSFTSIGMINIFQLNIFLYIWMFFILLTWLVIKYTKFGRNIFVLGSSMEVAKLSGINLRKTTYLTYSFAGFLCSISGILLTMRLYSAVPTGGQGYNLTGIAAAVIGGASLKGATGSVLGAVLGTLLVMLIRNGGVHIGITPFVMEVITGALIIIAVALDTFRKTD